MNKFASCIGIIMKSPEGLAPIDTPCKIIYNVKTGLIKSAYKINTEIGTNFSKHDAERTIWKKTKIYEEEETDNRSKNNKEENDI